MDERRFDEFARQLAVEGRSRRTAIKSLLGAVIGGAIAVTGTRGGDAATCRAPGSACREHANCCFKNCLPASKFRDRRSRCSCEGGALPCGADCCKGANAACCPGDGCVDLATDPQHCGACGNAAETDRNEGCCNGQITQLGTDTQCAYCGNDCTALGQGYHCAFGPEGLFCTNEACPPQPTTTGTITATGPCTITNTSATP
jgi:hypothetical protein